MPMKINVRFAIDRNHNLQIEPDEIVHNKDEMLPLDSNQDLALEGEELKEIFFEYGQDQWLPAGRYNVLRGDGWDTIINLRKIMLTDPMQVDMDIKIRPHS